MVNFNIFLNFNTFLSFKHFFFFIIVFFVTLETFWLQIPWFVITFANKFSY